MFSWLLLFFLTPFLPDEQSESVMNEVASYGNSSHHFPVRIEGHRGAGNLEHENSLSAFRRAIELGIDGVELDVWLTNDLVPVVSHGKALGLVDFENNKTGYLTKINAVDLPKYTLKNGEKVPTLAEVLDFCKGKINLNIDIKDGRDAVVIIVLDLLQEKRMLGQATLSSFIYKHAMSLRAEVMKRNIEPQVTFGYLMSALIAKLPNFDEAKAGDAIIFDVRYLQNKRDDCLAEMVKAQKRQVKIKFWFPIEFGDEHKYYDELMSLKIDTIITNQPLSLIEYFINKSK